MGAAQNHSKYKICQSPSLRNVVYFVLAVYAWKSYSYDSDLHGKYIYFLKMRKIIDFYFFFFLCQKSTTPNSKNNCEQRKSKFPFVAFQWNKFSTNKMRLGVLIQFRMPPQSLYLAKMGHQTLKCWNKGPMWSDEDKSSPISKIG